MGWSIFCVAGVVVNILFLVINRSNIYVGDGNFGLGARLLMACWIWVGMWVSIAGPNALMYFMTLKGVTRLENGDATGGN